jgi:hypothetical protein
MSNLKQFILKLTKATDVCEIEEIQSLWSGYGKIARYALEGTTLETVVVKNIVFPKQVNHPIGWNTDSSHLRKVKSYEVEIEWYKRFANLCPVTCRIPQCYGIQNVGEEQIIVLEDLDAAGFPIRKTALTKEEVKLCINWLAHFHATFLNIEPEGLWGIGTYWHLDTRADEFKAMERGPLKNAASEIDDALNSTQFKTLVHGDAKVANFCFSENNKQVAAVDFQYVGGGCGMKDVVYLLGSCLTEMECKLHENELLDFYFHELRAALSKEINTKTINALEKEWRGLYTVAWADFSRFLMGWMPTHQKINGYSKIQIEKALRELSY